MGVHRDQTLSQDCERDRLPLGSAPIVAHLGGTSNARRLTPVLSYQTAASPTLGDCLWVTDLQYPVMREALFGPQLTKPVRCQLGAAVAGENSLQVHSAHATDRLAGLEIAKVPNMLAHYE